MISLALPSYITSAVSSALLQDALLSHCACLPDSFLSSYSLEWSNLFGTTPAGDLARKQSSWDRPGISLDISQVWAGLHSSREKAVFLAASAQHSGSWLAALPISSCGLRLDNEAVRVAVALIRLGLHVCVPHECRCGSSVDAWGSHAFVCKRAMARSTRHQAINDIVARSIISSGVPVSKEPAGMISGSLKRPDGVTLIPWKGGKALSWDATVATTLADSYLEDSAAHSGFASESAASKKVAKYSNLPREFIFQPVALENLGPTSSSTAEFFTELGRRIGLVSGDPREEFYLRQRISVCIQRFNAVLLHQSFVDPLPEPDE